LDRDFAPPPPSSCRVKHRKGVPFPGLPKLGLSAGNLRPFLGMRKTTYLLSHPAQFPPFFLLITDRSSLDLPFFWPPDTSLVQIVVTRLSFFLEPPPVACFHRIFRLFQSNPATIFPPPSSFSRRSLFAFCQVGNFFSSHVPLPGDLTEPARAAPPLFLVLRKSLVVFFFSLFNHAALRT